MVTSGGCRGVTPLGHQKELLVEGDLPLNISGMLLPNDMCKNIYIVVIISNYHQQYEQFFPTESSTNLVALNDLF